MASMSTLKTRAGTAAAENRARRPEIGGEATSHTSKQQAARKEEGELKGSFNNNP
jgi:hypothetical protein